LVTAWCGSHGSVSHACVIVVIVVVVVVVVTSWHVPDYWLGMLQHPSPPTYSVHTARARIVDAAGADGLIHTGHTSERGADGVGTTRAVEKVGEQEASKSSTAMGVCGPCGLLAPVPCLVG